MMQPPSESDRDVLKASLASSVKPHLCERLRVVGFGREYEIVG